MVTSHNKFDIHQTAEVLDCFHVVAVGEDHMLAADILCKLFHCAGVGEDFQAGKLRSGIVPAELVPCGGVLASAV